MDLAARPLPVWPGRWVGRAHLLAAAARAARPGALVTVTGPGGVGKTRLAAEVARASGRRACWVELGAARTVGDAAAAVVRDAGGFAGAEPQDALAGHELVVLDGADWVAAELGAALRTWRAGAPDLGVLVTSRLPLHEVDEELVSVEPFGPDERAEAVQLFLRALPRLGPTPVDPALDADRLTAIVTALEGWPLAIELAAGRALVLPIDEIVARLTHPLELLRDPARPPSRDSALEVSLADSWSLLAAADRAALAHLSAFAATFDLAAARAVVAGPGDAADALQALVGRHLVRREPEGRFRLWDVVRAFAAARAAEAGDLDAARERHAAWYAGRVLAHDAASEAGYLALRRDAAELDAVVDRGEEGVVGGALQLAAATVAARAFPLQRLRLPPAGHLARLERCLEVPGLPRLVTVGLLRARAMVLRTLRDHPRTAEALQELRALADAAGDVRSAAWATAALGEAALVAGDLAGAEALLAEAVEQAVRHALPDLAVQARAALATRVLGRQRRWAEVTAHLRAALAAVDATVGPSARGQLQTGLAVAALAVDDVPEARRRLALARGAFGPSARPQHLLILLTQESTCVLAERGADGAAELRALAARSEDPVAPVYAAFAWAVAACADPADPGAQAASARWLALVRAPRDHRMIATVLAAARVAAGHALELPTPPPTPDPEEAALRETVTLLAAVRDGAADPDAAAAPDTAGDYGRGPRLLLDRAVAEARRERATWEVAPDGAWFRPPGGERVALGARPTLRRLLVALAEDRGQGLDAGAMFAAGWPGDRATERAATNRVRVAVTTLRQAGLGCLKWTRDRGWWLEVPTRFVAAEPD